MNGDSKRSRSRLSLLSVAGLLLAAPSLARGDGGLPDLTIALGASNIGSGLKVPSEGDGVNVPEVVQGSPARRIAGDGSGYLYVVIDHPAYTKGPVDVYVTVEFLDQSFGQLGLEYDRAGGKGGLADRYVPAGEALRLLDSGTWRQAVFHLPALRLGHGQNWGADFRLTGRRLTVRRITVSARRPAGYAPADAADDEPWLKPYTGPSRSEVDATTLDGKVLCGYQGWFNTPGDGTIHGFTHWGRGLGGPDGGRFTVDMWPDVSGYDPSDLREVPGLKMPDGSPARLYSAYRKGPVLLHTRWMRQYGIDGVFLSRFVSEAASPARARHVNRVLANIREGCHREGRVWAMMLDLSTGDKHPTTKSVIDDWKFLCDRVKVREDSRYLHQRGKPVVLLWGLGFQDRPWTPEQGAELVAFFKNDPKYGGVYLIGGVDPFWRTLGGGSRREPAWTQIYRAFDAISPWDAGRYHDNASMDRIRKQVWEGDRARLKRSGRGYMPTAFPGFSWDNLTGKAPGSTMIPRRKGEFYWRQFAIFRRLGVRTVFVGMFDEVDEGTAIYKVANQTPVGKHFVTYEGLPSDWYLKLTGAATRMIRGDAPLSWTIPDNLFAAPLPSP